jgi:hypothetical protein
LADALGAASQHQQRLDKSPTAGHISKLAKAQSSNWARNTRESIQHSWQNRRRIKARHDVSATGGTAKIGLRPPPVGLTAGKEGDRALAAGEPITRWPLKWAVMEKQAQGKKEGEEVLYLGMVYLSPDSKSPATDNNKRIANRLADVETRAFETGECGATGTSVLRTTDRPNLRSSKKKWQLLHWEKGIHGGVERGRLLTWRRGLKRGEALVLRRPERTICALKSPDAEACFACYLFAVGAALTSYL